MNKKFVKTSDEETANHLRTYLNELPKEGKYYVFINDSTVYFSKNIQKDKIIYTNKMCI